MALVAKQVLLELLVSCLALAARQVQLGLQVGQWFMMKAMVIAELVTHFLCYPRISRMVVNFQVGSLVLKQVMELVLEQSIVLEKRRFQLRLPTELQVAD